MLPARFPRCLLLLSVLVIFSTGPVWAGVFSNGPIIGHVTHNSAMFWARAGATGGALKIELSETPDFKNVLSAAPVRFDAKQDRTATVALTGLKPATTYYWRAFAGEAPFAPPGDLAMRFRTFPLPGAKTVVRLGFGSCNHVARVPDSGIWNAVAKADVDAFVWMGDNIYADLMPEPVTQNMYRRARAVPSLQQVNLTVPQYATWDDHDFGSNDLDRTFTGKPLFLKVFKQYWPNPSYGEAENPGVYTRFSAGPADVFLLDVRYHRAPNGDPDGPEKTMLGEAQLAWLKAGLKASAAPVKLLVSGSAWNDCTCNGDNWMVHGHARTALFDFIRDEKITGVVLVSGDTHVGELNALPRKDKGGYDLIELVASPLANNPDAVEGYAKGGTPRLRPVYGEGNNFGLITVDNTGAEAVITLELRTPEGKPVWPPVVLNQSELTNGQGDWTKHKL